MGAGGPGTCIDLRDRADEALRWEEACAAAYERIRPDSGPAHVHRIFRSAETGERTLTEWVDPHGAPAGVLVWEPVPEVGRRVVLGYLDSAHQDRSSFAALLTAFESFEPTRGPVFVIPDGLPGLLADDQAAVLEAADWIRLEEVTLVFPSSAPVPGATLGRDWTIRPPTADDRPALLTLAARAYREYPGQLGWPQVDLERDLTLYLDQLGTGRHRVIASATFVLVVGPSLAGHIVTSRDDHGPFIDSVQVDPRWQGRGIGRALLVRSLQALRDAGSSEEVAVVYLRQNSRAGSLYRSVGFVPTAQRRHVDPGLWVRRRTLRAVLERASTAKFRSPR